MKKNKLFIFNLALIAFSSCNFVDLITFETKYTSDYQREHPQCTYEPIFVD